MPALAKASLSLLRRAFHAVTRVPQGADAAHRGWDQVPLPDSWYILMRSGDLRPGAVRGAHVMGRDLVVFRTRRGQVGVLDAYCPHFGADLRGGAVRDDRLICPFHGLAWETDGGCANRESLFSADHFTATTAHPVIERNEAIHVWLSREPTLPTWEPPQLGKKMRLFSRELAPVAAHLVVESIACYDAEHARHSHRSIFDLLRFRTIPELNRVLLDPDQPQQLSVQVFLEHTILPLALRFTATFHGPSICSAETALKTRRGGDFWSVAARTYSGLVPADQHSHVADNAVYLDEDASVLHRVLTVVFTFWVHTVMHHDDIQVWNQLSFNRGGSHYEPFWRWYNQFTR
jgi:nitrite reductase/ring-hydroxylating ferredoxin subunit